MRFCFDGLLRQGVVGGICFCINLFLMWLLVSFFEFGIAWATFVCFVVLNLFGHHLSRVFVFYVVGGSYRAGLVRYFFVMCCGLFFNIAAMFFLTSILGVHYLLASFCVAVLFFIGNFVVHKSWTFRRNG